MQNRDYAVSAIRFISMIFIISCHIMQYFDFGLAWWFNVGVQIFLCISGYLYGSKETIDDIVFLKRGFVKILKSFYIVLLPFLLINFLLGYISVRDAVSALLCARVIKGGGHLWFIPTILMCYFLTPFLAKYFNSRDNEGRRAVKLLCAAAVCFVVFKIFIPFFNPAVISCYIIGFALARIRDKKAYGCYAVGFIGAAVVFNMVRIAIGGGIISNSQTVYTMFCDYSHTLLGTSLFIVFRKIFGNIKPRRLLRFSDKYSYEIYLIHQFLILGPLSMMRITPFYILNILIILTAVVISAAVVHRISHGVLTDNLKREHGC